MRPLVWTLCVCLAILLTAGSGSTQERLGDYPLCEPSTALQGPCLGEPGHCLLVADNEQSDRLFMYPIREGSLAPHSQIERSFGDDVEIDDIEAVIRLPDGALMVFGSHSRNKSCEARKKRRRFMLARYAGDGTLHGTPIKSKRLSCQRLFGDTQHDHALRRAVCTAIAGAEAKADLIEKMLEDGGISRDMAKKRCNATEAFNTEGAVAVPDASAHRVWVGLRAPLVAAVPGHPDKRAAAVLMQMQDSTAYRFDAVALLDLGGRGVRELASDGNWIWGIAGPAPDADEPFELWRFPIEKLKPDAVITPTMVQSLPTSSEGLAVSEAAAYVVIDGDRGEENGHCKVNGTYKLIRLPSQ